MAIQMHPLGFIRGGVCNQRLNRRRARACGSWMAWNDIKNNPEYVRVKNDWYQVLKHPPGRDIREYGGGDCEIGYLRILQSVFPQLIKNKVKFRMKWMAKWLEGTAACEFGAAMDNPLSIITPGEGVTFTLVPPNGFDDMVYEKLHGVPAGLAKKK